MRTKAKRKPKSSQEKAVLEALESLGATIDKGDTKAAKRAFKALCLVAVPVVKQAQILRKYIELSNKAAENVAAEILKELK